MGVGKGRKEKEEVLTSVGLLADHVRDGAAVGDVHGLLLDRAAAVVEALGLVHGALERVSLPAEEVVTVRAVSRTVIPLLASTLPTCGIARIDEWTYVSPKLYTKGCLPFL